jgi:ribosomal protein S12 methylthiotransferase accessory factor
MANSSGTAANRGTETAVRHAVFELVERDAFMITWLNRLETPRIIHASLPSWAQRRIGALEREGFRVIVKDLTLDLAPVILVFAQSDVLPMTTCSACSSFEPVEALKHALEEVEAGIYCRLRNPIVQPINPLEVHRTYHHGDLYGRREYYCRADFLAHSSKTLPFSRTAGNAPRTWEHLLERFNTMGLSLVTVDLGKNPHCQRKKGLTIVKVFVPGIIPMSFGYGLEPCGMERLYSLPVQLGYRKAPLKYRGLERFPHPYT